MKKLVCHTSMKNRNNNNSVLTPGKKYPIIEEEEDTYVIIDDEGDRNHFNKKEKGEEGTYKNWFDLIDEAEEIAEPQTDDNQFKFTCICGTVSSADLTEEFNYKDILHCSCGRKILLVLME